MQFPLKLSLLLAALFGASPQRTSPLHPPHTASCFASPPLSPAHPWWAGGGSSLIMTSSADAMLCSRRSILRCAGILAPRPRSPCACEPAWKPMEGLLLPPPLSSPRWREASTGTRAGALSLRAEAPSVSARRFVRHAALPRIPRSFSDLLLVLNGKVASGAKPSIAEVEFLLGQIADSSKIGRAWATRERVADVLDVMERGGVNMTAVAFRHIFACMVSTPRAGILLKPASSDTHAGAAGRGLLEGIGRSLRDLCGVRRGSHVS